MKRFLQIVLFLAIVLAVLYASRYFFNTRSLPLWSDLKSQILTKYFPCKEPIPYTLGTFDAKFNLSQKEFLDALAEAEAVWEKPSGIDLFTYEPLDTANSVLKINLIYDYREQATTKLATLGITVKNTRASYDALKSKLTDLKLDYTKQKTAFDTSIQDFNAKKKDYDTQVAYWNAKGGAPEKEYNQLQAEGAALKVQSKDIAMMENDLNATIDEINSLVVSLNGIAKALNLSVDNYNTISTSRGDTFEEGVYQTDGLTREIDIYEFSSKEKLVRVLAHEFGHALGLEHVDDPKAIMYKLNEGTNASIDDTDLQALKALCEVN